jgi:hypothetical protein
MSIVSDCLLSLRLSIVIIRVLPSISKMTAGFIIDIRRKLDAHISHRLPKYALLSLGLQLKLCNYLK